MKFVRQFATTRAATWLWSAPPLNSARAKPHTKEQDEDHTHPSRGSLSRFVADPVRSNDLRPTGMSTTATTLLGDGKAGGALPDLQSGPSDVIIDATANDLTENMSEKHFADNFSKYDLTVEGAGRHLVLWNGVQSDIRIRKEST